MRRFLLAATLCLVIGLLGGLLTLAVGPSAAPARYRFVPPREAAFDFNLKDQDGQPQSIAAARGKVLAITFLFSTCHDLCPAEANLIGAAAEKVGDGVLVYAVSVDPDGDTPERAKAFIKRRGADPGSLQVPARHARGAQARLARVRDRPGQRHARGRDRRGRGDRQVPRRGRRAGREARPPPVRAAEARRARRTPGTRTRTRTTSATAAAPATSRAWTSSTRPT